LKRTLSSLFKWEIILCLNQPYNNFIYVLICLLCWQVVDHKKKFVPFVLPLVTKQICPSLQWWRFTSNRYLNNSLFCSSKFQRLFRMWKHCAISYDNFSQQHNFHQYPTYFETLSYQVLSECQQFWYLLWACCIF
jgi:hypothetical protein